MHSRATAIAIQYGGDFADAVLLVILFSRGRWKTFPAFTLLITLYFVASLSFDLVLERVSHGAYIVAYTVFALSSLCVETAIVYELARNVLRPAGIWDRQALRPLLVFSIGFTAVAAALALLVQSRQLPSIALWDLRGEIFTGFLISSAVVAMMLSARAVGLHWRSHAMAVGQGLMVWALADVSILGAFAFFGPEFAHSHVLYYLRSGAYILTVLYWSVALWHEEPARKPISPALRNYIVALHEQVHYDLGNTRN